MTNTSVISNSEIKIHPSCMIKEVIEILKPENRKNIVDATFGTGGHSLEILKKTKGNLFAFEKDPFLYERGKKISENFKNFKIFNKSFTEIPEILQKEGVNKIDGILFDFGLSLYHVSSSNRGFTFKRKEILDMRCNPYENEELYKKLKKIDLEEIEFILKEYGELKNYKKISLNIYKGIKEREIKYTDEFNKIILKNIKHNKEKILQKVYQAFRIWINQEIENIKKTLSFLPQIMESGGVAVFLSYHSLEDRIIKNFFKNSYFKFITKKPLKPSEKEIEEKPNCHSCKLRAGEKK